MELLNAGESMANYVENGIKNQLENVKIGSRIIDNLIQQIEAISLFCENVFFFFSSD